MQAVATDVAHVMVYLYVSVCWSQPRAVQKWLNRLIKMPFGMLTHLSHGTITIIRWRPHSQCEREIYNIATMQSCSVDVAFPAAEYLHLSAMGAAHLQYAADEPILHCEWWRCGFSVPLRQQLVFSLTWNSCVICLSVSSHWYVKHSYTVPVGLSLMLTTFLPLNVCRYSKWHETVKQRFTSHSVTWTTACCCGTDHVQLTLLAFSHRGFVLHRPKHQS